MPAVRRGLRMGRYLHNAHRRKRSLPRIARLPERRGSGLIRARSPRTELSEPATRSALCFLHAALAATLLSSLLIHSRLAEAAGPKSLPPEVACSQIREAIHKVAAAERDQALALHLMADGKPTPMVQTRLTQLQAKIGDLREVLRRARD